uniref:Uncharacterized protein n=1 Tax=Medicago truncatula TaxID=3880 RepID=Q2HVV3_MEDTR|nr:hypothetical protein MtrDRAFT_AC148340g23v2 [Medicago truncatula]
MFFDSNSFVILFSGVNMSSTPAMSFSAAASLTASASGSAKIRLSSGPCRHQHKKHHSFLLEM